MKLSRSFAAAGVALALAIPAAPAFAQYSSPTASPTVTSERDETTPRPRATTTVRGRTTQRPPSGSTGGLSATGSDIALLAIIGLGSAGSGALLVASSRRRRRSDDAE